MREIKFRVWDKKLKKITPVGLAMINTNEYFRLIQKIKYRYVYLDGSGREWKYNLSFNYLRDKDIFEVIGNIYENPELLEGKK